MTDFTEQVFETIRKLQAGEFNPADVARFDAPASERGVSMYALSGYLIDQSPKDVAKAIKQLVYEERLKEIYEDQLPTFYIP